MAWSNKKLCQKGNYGHSICGWDNDEREDGDGLDMSFTQPLGEGYVTVSAGHPGAPEMLEDLDILGWEL